jgi:hypothetical protein
MILLLPCPPLSLFAEASPFISSQEKNLSSATNVSAGNGRYHTEESTRGAGEVCDFDNYLA